MFEIITEAIVLDKEDLGESDSRVFLYTKDLGKVAAKATSLRKITSKLAAHLEPFNWVTARLVSRSDFADSRNFQLAEALLIDNAGDLKSNPANLRQAIEAVNLIRKSIPESAPDENLWQVLQNIRSQKTIYSIQEILKILGLDLEFAGCELCRKPGPEYFYPRGNFFTCRTCRLASKETKENFIRLCALIQK
ncbi:MAG: DNA repair protein RecO [Candidatus Harrisonbacteria bacterium]|nr:DNA repair protein RecO [Candidatus Harrisonbacteria bacterium]